MLTFFSLCGSIECNFVQDLRLAEEVREMVYKGVLSKRDGELQVYLFDHALLFTKGVKTKQLEQYKVYRRVSFRFLFCHFSFAEPLRADSP